MAFVPSLFPASAFSALGLTVGASFPIHRAAVNVFYSEMAAMSKMASKRATVKEEDDEEEDDKEDYEDQDEEDYAIDVDGVNQLV